VLPSPFSRQSVYLPVRQLIFTGGKKECVTVPQIVKASVQKVSKAEIFVRTTTCPRRIESRLERAENFMRFGN
jgi:hypothetical protein